MKRNLFIKNDDLIILDGKLDVRQGEIALNLEEGKIPQKMIDTDGLLKTEDIVDDLTSDATDKPLSAYQGKRLKTGIDALDPGAIDGYVTKDSIVDDLTTGGSENVLSAEQGKVLKDIADDLGDDVEDLKETKADINGYYSTMASGSAEGLVGVPDAVGTLNGLPQDYISKDSMDHILTAMVTAGVISAYTLTWNDLSNSYSCTITA